MIPQFVLVPGLHGTSGLFNPLLDILPAQVIELPKKGPQDYRHLGAWLSSKVFPKSYILVGESFAGPLTLQHAAKNPRGLKGVVLLGSFARMKVPLARFIGHLLPPLPLGWRIFRPANQRMLFSGQASEGQMDWLQAELSKTSAMVLRARMQAVMLGDVCSFLPKIRVAVLAITATRDHMVPPQAGDDFSLIPRIQRSEIDSPHVIAGSHPRQLAAMLFKFRKSLETGSVNIKK